MSDSESDSESSSSSSIEQLKSHPVLDWYSKLNSRRVDIVGDYAGNELFLVEGDSVLLNAFSDQHLDFDPGFQLLHATYAVEHFLRGLIARRCNFHIAFFDDHSELCVPHSASDASREKYLLARTAIIRHLSVNLKLVHPDTELHSFPSVRSKAFANYLETTDIYFIMCHDGASSSALRKRNILAKHLNALEDEDHEALENELRTKTTFRLLISWFVERGYNAALVNGLEWLDTKIITTVLENIRRGQRHEWPESQRFSEVSDRDKGKMTYDQAALAQIKSPTDQPFTERELLTILTLSQFAVRNGTLHEYGSALLGHAALLSELPIAERRLRHITLPDSARGFLLKFTELSRSIMNSQAWSTDMSDRSALCDVADLVDGRLFAACLKDGQSGSNTRYQALLEGLGRLCGTDINSVASNGKVSGESDDEPPSPTSEENKKAYAVLPFSNSVFDTHLSPVHLAIDKSGEISSATSAHIFREVSHWHNSNRPIDSKAREEHSARSVKQQFFARRRNQWFMAEMMAYAGSLTNAVGRSLEPEIVTTGPKAKITAPQAPEKKADNVKPKAAPKGNKKGGGKKAIMEEIAATKKAKDETNSEKVFQGWRTTLSSLEKEGTPPAKYQRAKLHLATLNTDFKLAILEAEVRLYMLHVLLGMWLKHCREDTEEEGLPLAALIFDNVKSFSKIRGTVTKTICSHLATTIKALELPPLEIPVPDGDRPIHFTFALSNTQTADLSIPLPPKQFQLLHCGPYFERSMDSAPDHRVPFEPDGWQRKVLDEIDAKRSLLVIAPTSAGKTFISFYAMKQVLESTDEDILVYVAPTKALVNQIAAEVQARFTKSYKYPGKSVWGIHTRDYRINNPTGCQILVTVPHILQIMLLAPSNANSWSRRVKWIIFDEVHCIGQADDGLIWEQLLLLAPCPIIALSATIGNPQEFNDWLVSTQKAIGNELVMVAHPHRYSDLRKFVYTPPTSFKFEGLPDSRAFGRLGLDGIRGFHFIHPVACLVNRARGMPDDLSLEARDCQMLWESMVKHQTPNFKVDKSLDPAQALPAVVKKSDIIKWETSLKTLLRQWLADNESPFDKVISELSAPLRDVEAKTQAVQTANKNGHSSKHSKKHVETTLPLLIELHKQDALPGIIFNYDRGLCEEMCRHLSTQLEEAETAWKESSPKWKAKLENWEAWKKAVAKAGKRGPPKISKKKATGGDDEALSKADLMMDSANTETSPWASFNPDDPVEGFHFADHKKMTQDELNRYFKELIRRDVETWLLNALRRGIGVHHAGMNRKYRQVVEMLFRKGYLRVVVATGTLALGINMPCKTVIFSGDSVFLSALNYRQAAGRAGRRGFDNLGNVVFHGVSMSKVHRLISSRLPDLNGHFPITTTLVLRLFTLLNESKESPFAVRSINALLSQPRLYLGGEESKMTVLHHLRFSIEYLRRQFLLDSEGAPLNFAGCVSHLYFTENSSFAFHALLKDGYFHNLCAEVDKKQTEVLETLMITMAHLFGRQHCRQADEEFVEEIIKKSPSVVFLPPIPEKAAVILREHNSSTLDIFTAYVRTFVEQHISYTDDTLPLTQIKIGGDSLPKSALNLPRRTPTKVRSSFVALSGHDDNFKSIHDLCETSRSGVFLEEAVVPYVGLYPEESEMPLNAYLYDFFMHGDVKALAKANRIRSGDVWFVLNDFSMVLATIVTSLSNFMKLTPESDLDFTDVRGEGDEEEERKEDTFLPTEDSGYETASTASGIVGKNQLGPGIKQELAVRNVKKSKKVAESWDDDADEELEIENAEKERKRKMKKAEETGEKPAWEEGAGLLNVLKAFKLLREEFDMKFRAMWA
ncbi:DEAD/DEAH box helicase-like protein [Clohesyomyces aquaticus]|uniref:DEAD/DEAH box helicase-like protein n=1 Tax=Clohesyomyces aquaticus TaxID=1231657 RepID=A0A1Y1Y2Y0_9PLEO|nr:DEAD/DEAH box helicase-like protein [Clohesyomyces aquaticus]